MPCKFKYEKKSKIIIYNHKKLKIFKKCDFQRYFLKKW